MVLAQCLVVGAPFAFPSRAFSYSTARLVVRASSSEATPTATPASSAAPPAPIAAAELAWEGGDATLETLPAAPGGFRSLVSRTPQLITPEGAAEVAQVNYYNILQIPYGASTSQIANAFKERVEELTSRQKEGEEDAYKQELRLLQESFEVLTTVEERRMYDWVMKRYENRSDTETYIWPYETDITQRYDGKKEPTVMRSFDQEGNNKVGLFFLGWFVISVIFSLTMKTYLPSPPH